MVLDWYYQHHLGIVNNINSGASSLTYSIRNLRAQQPVPFNKSSRWLSCVLKLENPLTCIISAHSCLKQKASSLLEKISGFITVHNKHRWKLKKKFFFKSSLKDIFLLTFRARTGGGERERGEASMWERNIGQLSTIRTPTWIWTWNLAYVCALIRNWTCSLLVYGTMFQLTEPPGHGRIFFLI